MRGRSTWIAVHRYTSTRLTMLPFHNESDVLHLKAIDQGVKKATGGWRPSVVIFEGDTIEDVRSRARFKAWLTHIENEEAIRTRGYYLRLLYRLGERIARNELGMLLRKKSAAELRGSCCLRIGEMELYAHDSLPFPWFEGHFVRAENQRRYITARACGLFRHKAQCFSRLHQHDYFDVLFCVWHCLMRTMPRSDISGELRISNRMVMWAIGELRKLGLWPWDPRGPGDGASKRNASGDPAVGPNGDDEASAGTLASFLKECTAIRNRLQPTLPSEPPEDSFAIGLSYVIDDDAAFNFGRYVRLAYAEFEAKLGEIVSGTIQRFEGDTVIVNLGGTTEGILPRAEKVRSENYNVGERIRALIYEVKKVGPRVKVILSRTHRDLVRALFELEVPEISDGTITIRRIEREPGYRTKLAVDSNDEKVDCVGACVGVRGSRIKSIIDELNGERIDIIRWNNDPSTLIANALKPAEVGDITLDPTTKKALVIVNEDQQSLAIGRKGQNVRLASKLTGWDIDIMTRAELERSVADDNRGEAGAATPASLTADRAGEDAKIASSDAQSPPTAPAGTEGPATGSSEPRTDKPNPDPTAVESPSLADGQSAGDPT
jgi:N utilization substance protein A